MFADSDGFIVHPYIAPVFSIFFKLIKQITDYINPSDCRYAIDEWTFEHMPQNLFGIIDFFERCRQKAEDLTLPFMALCQQYRHLPNMFFFHPHDLNHP